MKLFFQYIFIAVLSFIVCSLLFSCDKVNINFGNASTTGDPNVAYFQDSKISLQTLQIDSFLTSSTSTFLVGYYRDPVFGIIHSSSYVQLQLPGSNPIYNQNVTFDSLVLIIKPKGLYYGDTTRPFSFKIYQLSELMQNFVLTNNNYYNNRSFSYNPNPIGGEGQSFTIYPGNSSDIGIKMDSSLGKDLLNRFQTNDQAITDQTSFLNYFNGLYIDADSTSTNSIYDFNTSSDTLMMRLYYNINGINVVPKYLSFGFTPAKQFNHIEYNRTGTALSSFPPFVNNKAILGSAFTGNKAYINSSSGSYIKISFPDILNLKILHPYIQVLSAQLVIPPSPGTHNYPYKLPPTLSLYATDDNNDVLGVITASGSTTPQTGNLFIDNLYGQTTQYSYDITSFISSQLNPPPNPTATFATSLLLSPSSSLGDESLTRLVINDQSLAPGVMLKLYVLGL